MNLLILKVNQLGDNVVFLPIVQTLRRLRPDWKLRLMTSPLAAPLYEADLEPSSLLAVPTQEFNGAWKHPLRLLWLTLLARRNKADAVLLGNDQGNVACLLSWLAGAPIRVGVYAEYLKASFLLTDRLPMPRNPSIAHLNWAMAAHFVKRLGVEDWPEHPPAPDLSHLSKGAEYRRQRVVIHPWASQDCKRWALESFVALANRLSEKYEVVWIHYESAAKVSLTASVRRVSPANIRELCQWIASAALFVGNNSGPMNLAFALGTPTIIINGPSHRMWDPVWFAERSMMLRDITLACSPCDSALNPRFKCVNKRSPMTCMQRWDVATLERLCMDWHERWSGIRELEMTAKTSKTSAKGTKVCADS